MFAADILIHGKIARETCMMACSDTEHHPPDGYVVALAGWQNLPPGRCFTKQCHNAVYQEQNDWHRNLRRPEKNGRCRTGIGDEVNHAELASFLPSSYQDGDLACWRWALLYRCRRRAPRCLSWRQHRRTAPTSEEAAQGERLHFMVLSRWQWARRSAMHPVR